MVEIEMIKLFTFQKGTSNGNEPDHQVIPP